MTQNKSHRFKKVEMIYYLFQLHWYDTGNQLQEENWGKKTQIQTPKQPAIKKVMDQK